MRAAEDSVRGSALVQAMVLVLLAALTAALCLQLTMGRAVIVERVNSTVEKRAVAEAALAEAWSCIQSRGALLSPPKCDPSSLTCLPASIQGDARLYAVSVAVAPEIVGADTRCKITITVPD